MVGLGETEEEVFETMDDLLKVGCKVLTVGQYLQPSAHHLKIEEYVKPEIFIKYQEAALGKGFSMVESSPLVRSSYHAERHINA
jgi:lipoic acid synthetase